jgi:hypothetical protein
MDWALFWSDQKSGTADCFSSAAISFSLPAMSKMHHRQGDPGLQFGEFIRFFLHFYL